MGSASQFARSCVTVASGQFLRSKDVCSQTLVSRNSSENSLFALDAWMMTGVECWESHECNKPGQLRTDCSVYKKRIAEKGNKPNGKTVETTAVAQGVMVETLEYDDGMLIESRFGFRVWVDNKRQSISTVSDSCIFN